MFAVDLEGFLTTLPAVGTACGVEGPQGRPWNAGWGPLAEGSRKVWSELGHFLAVSP